MNYSLRFKGIRYCGAKGKCGGVVKTIDSFLQPGDTYFEPFVGAGKVVQGIRPDVRRFCSDADPTIVALLRAIQRGWVPPTKVTEEEYRYWMGRRKDKTAPKEMLAFIGYGCSFGGRYFEGFARSKKATVNFAASARRSLLRQKPFLEGVEFRIRDYRKGWWLKEPPTVIYADPPYLGTKPVGSFKKKFNTDEFWSIATEWAKESTVLVSEYECPLQEAVVRWQRSIAASLRTGTGGDGGAKGDGRRKTERLYLLGKPRKRGGFFH